MDFNISETEAKGKFIRDFNLLIPLIDSKLKKLGFFNEENLALILRDKIYEIESEFSVYQKTSFFSSITGIVIVELFKDLLYFISDKMDKAYEKQNSSSLYAFVHMFIAEKWYIEYKAVCDSYKNTLTVRDYSQSIVMKFFEYIKTLDLTYEELVDLVITFKTELIVLTKEDIRIDIGKEYVKKLKREDNYE